MHGSVLKITFRVLAREFESYMAFPGFAQLLGDNWVLHRTQINTLTFFFVVPQHSYQDFHHLAFFSKIMNFAEADFVLTKKNKKPVI